MKSTVTNGARDAESLQWKSDAPVVTLEHKSAAASRGVSSISGCARGQRKRAGNTLSRDGVRLLGGRRTSAGARRGVAAALQETDRPRSSAGPWAHRLSF